ncbi:MAG TPA: hypothetical protein VJA22_02450, partial [Patescibacteria group bacterium]|nr:hypothetical protein [Patescibacteria group bacterium]
MKKSTDAIQDENARECFLAELGQKVEEDPKGAIVFWKENEPGLAVPDQDPFFLEFEVKMLLYQAYLGIGNVEEAKKILRRVIAKTNNPSAMGELVKICMEQGDLEEAEEISLRACHVGDGPRDYAMASEVYIKIGDVTKAIRYARVAVHKSAQLQSCIVQERMLRERGETELADSFSGMVAQGSSPHGGLACKDYGTLAKAYLLSHEPKDLDLAIRSAEMALELGGGVVARSLLAKSLLRKAIVVRGNNEKTSREYAEKALAFAMRNLQELDDTRNYELVIVIL